ncbi:unnamed protein product, partial [Mesorhabditis spiculigera]
MPFSNPDASLLTSLEGSSTAVPLIHCRAFFFVDLSNSSRQYQFFDLLQSNIKGVASKLYNDPRLDFQANYQCYGDDLCGGPDASTTLDQTNFNAVVDGSFDEVSGEPHPNAQTIEYAASRMGVHFGKIVTLLHTDSSQTDIDAAANQWKDQTIGYSFEGDDMSAVSIYSFDGDDQETTVQNIVDLCKLYTNE